MAKMEMKNKFVGVAKINILERHLLWFMDLSYSSL